MAVSTDKQKIEELLTRGVDEVIVYEHLKERLASGEVLRIKFGIDPTGSDLHLGHAVPLRKLRQFQDMGHQIILLIGDYTATIGDPTGKKETRPVLTDSEIKENMKTYIEQASKILDMDSVEIRYNSEWYSKKGFDFMLELSSKVTVARVLERADFKDRLSEDSDIHMQEILYPLLQGYDSVELQADVEIGGRDQKINLLMGRRLQKKYDQSPQDVLTVPLIEGTDGHRKMSKTYQNYIGLQDSSVDMYGKAMSIPDELILKYFELMTDLSLSDIEVVKSDLSSGKNPRDSKARLAYELVRMYHSDELAQHAQEQFDATFKDHSRPEDIAELAPTKSDIVSILVEAGFAKSNSDARRLIEQGGIKINDVKVEKIDQQVTPGEVVQKGKRFFVKIV